PLRRLPRPGRPDEAAPAESGRDAFNERDTLLLEIGVEELPHGDIAAVQAQAPGLVEGLLKDSGLEHGPVTVWVTPRRIAVRVEDLPARQEDTEVEARGPKKSAAQDENGAWTMPAIRFSESQGATPDDIFFQKQGKFEYCFVNVKKEGRHLADLLSDLVAQLLRGIQFRKSMGWEDSTATFSRPVRWILALHGSTVVPAAWRLREASDLGPERTIYSGRITYGHRRLAPGPIKVANASEYLAAVRDRYVLPDRAERMAALRDKVEALCAPLGVAPEDDADLFDEICDLAEFPEPILCEIPKEALDLPEQFIITPMKVHQRYIPLRTPDGALSGHFLAVANGEHSEEGRTLIRHGNERVLNARLRDAKYFWDTDTKTPLAEFAKGLSRVLFHKELGTVADKIGRLRVLYGTLKPLLPPVDDAKLEQVLELMKADLTTQMVFEFDSLQGVVGMLYAKKEGLDGEVADAIFEHWLPRRAGDALPTGPLGVVAGLLDRLDSLAGYFAAGIRPKGTSDPFGLRRNALAVLSIIESAGIDLDLDACLRGALAALGGLVADADTLRADLLAFFNDRLAVLTREQGSPHDYVNAALGAHGRRPVRFQRCVAALAGLDEQKVQDLAEQAKRMQRIATEPAECVEPARLGDNEEAMWALCDTPAAEVKELAGNGEFAAALDKVVAWVPVINTYFEEVLVNDKDDAVRRNRHALIRDVFAALTAVADFTQIEKK
ncbi:MAG: glycine--tRNA ligase subunit beta, partial [Candidatus Hydrogenedentes bacterium]|nr:glycine--tRNA ligase subunit beta [Candidatus Hydrogenedentota bacterium]